MRTKIICDPIEIKSQMTRTEIVQKMINLFINTEQNKRGKGVQFWYPVEDLSSVPELPPEQNKLFIFRPGGLQKWNFDFKVNVIPEFNLGKGTHSAIASDILNKKQENPQKFTELLKSLEVVYNCSENNIDQLLNEHPDLQSSFKIGATPEVLLKIVKWMFIMEDIVYWNYEGRTKLYNYLKEL